MRLDTETTIDAYGVAPIRVRSYVRAPEVTLSHWPDGLGFGPDGALGRDIRITEGSRATQGVISHVEALPNGLWRLRFELDMANGGDGDE